MAGQVLLVADRSEAVIQVGQPPAQLGAWLLDIPPDWNALETASDFAGKQGFPIGTTARVIDLSNPAETVGAAMSVWRLDSQWVPVSG